MPNLVAYINNDNLLVVANLKNGGTNLYVNNAVVTVRVLNGAGSPVSGQTWPTALTHDGGTDGRYTGQLEDTIAWTEGTYTLEVTATGDGLKGFWKLPVSVKDRTA